VAKREISIPAHENPQACVRVSAAERQRWTGSSSETGGCRFGLEEASGGRIRFWLLAENRHPLRSLSSRGAGVCDPPTVTQAAPSLGSDPVSVLQPGGEGERPMTPAVQVDL
jgi:hypothetical protein